MGTTAATGERTEILSIQGTENTSPWDERFDWRRISATSGQPIGEGGYQTDDEFDRRAATTPIREAASPSWGRGNGDLLGCPD
jgi:hypothetical protein